MFRPTTILATLGAAKLAAAVGVRARLGGKANMPATYLLPTIGTDTGTGGDPGG
jgi:hypothetical protein